MMSLLNQYISRYLAWGNNILAWLLNFRLILKTCWNGFGFNLKLRLGQLVLFDRCSTTYITLVLLDGDTNMLIVCGPKSCFKAIGLFSS